MASELHNLLDNTPDVLLERVKKEVHRGFLACGFLQMKYNINYNRAKRIIKQIEHGM